MKLKNMWKRFWTLDVHNHEGFTLVELIIVIAILAILSTGAIAGYSAYVTSANKTADEALAAEIENVMILAYYNGTLKDGATVVIHFGDVDAQAETGYGTEQVLIDAYGDNWAQALRLKWNGWKSGVAVDADRMQAVKESNFKGENLDGMLSQVQVVVGAAADRLAGTDITEGMAAYLDKAGINYDKDTMKFDATNAGAGANAFVFSVAGNISNKVTAEKEADFENAWMLYMEGDVAADDEFDLLFGDNSVEAAAVKYAATLSLAQYMDSVNGNTNYQDRLMNYGDADIRANQDALRTEMMDVLNNDDKFSGYGDMVSKDQQAFLAYMSGVNSSEDAIIKDMGLQGDNYFDNDSLLGYVNNYLTLSDAAIAAGAADGTFVFVLNNGQVSCLPLDYSA